MLETRNLIFIHGKGGVGRTTVALATARLLASRSRSSLLVRVDAPGEPEGAKIQKESQFLSRLNIQPAAAFEEYIERTIKIPALARVFARTSLIRALSKVAPGVRELVTLGKIWDLRKDFDHIVVDLPSSGYGLAMFHSMGNFMKLFGSGRSFEDSQEMLQTFTDPQAVAHWIVTLPEELPLTESAEILEVLRRQFPEVPIQVIVNQLVPNFRQVLELPPPKPEQRDAISYLYQRAQREDARLKESALPFAAWLELEVEPGPAIERQLSGACT